MEPRRTLPKPDLDLAPAVPAASLEDPLAQELSRKMQGWGQIWFGAEVGSASAEQSRVRQRLLFWLKRLMGGDAGAVLADGTQDLSLAKSTPLLTAFLGRRTMVEVSRRVLSDE